MTISHDDFTPRRRTRRDAFTLLEMFAILSVIAVLMSLMLPAIQQARDAARQNREFMNRAAAWLSAQGVDQFLDIGTGIPTEPNLHQIVQGVVPTAKVEQTGAFCVTAITSASSVGRSWQKLSRNLSCAIHT